MLKSTVEQSPKKAATAGSWKPGQSGNAKGRPSTLAGTLADAMRLKFPPERIVDLAEQLVTSAQSEQVKLAALQLIAERAHGKVASDANVTLTNGNAEPASFDHLSLERRREILAELRAGRTDGEP